MNLMELAKEFGPYIGLIFFFIWRGTAREDRQDAELKAKNEFIQGELIRLVEKVTEALNEKS